MTQTLIAAAAALAMAAAALNSVQAAPAGAKNIVLVHGGFVDGSGWQGVYNILKKDGYNVSIVQNPTPPRWPMMSRSPSARLPSRMALSFLSVIPMAALSSVKPVRMRR